MLVKVCGMRQADNIAQLSMLKPDYVGFIFYKESLRYAGEIVTPELLSSHLKEVKKVGVFVNADEKEVLKTSQYFGLDVAQLHGNESPKMCAALKANGLEVWKVFHPKNEDVLLQTEKYEGVCDFFLFDTPSVQYGGSGEKFDWSFLPKYKGNTSFFLSGGIGPDDLQEVLKIAHPKLVGLDLNSRFEILPAIKDIPLLAKFIAQLREFRK